MIRISNNRYLLPAIREVTININRIAIFYRVKGTARTVYTISTVNTKFGQDRNDLTFNIDFVYAIIKLRCIHLGTV